jgi:hypothetical protein
MMAISPLLRDLNDLTRQALVVSLIHVELLWARVAHTRNSYPPRALRAACLAFAA